MIPSTANVAIPAASPDSRMSGIPDEQRVHRPDAGGEQERRHVSDRVVPEQREEIRQLARLRVRGAVMTPAANAPTATKLVCPNESTPELPTKT